MDVARFLALTKNFFREDTSEFVGAYFDGETIFLVRQTETFEVCEVAADGDDFERLAEKISAACRLRDWKTSAIGFCLRERDVVIFQTEISNVPEKDFPALVESWSRAQSGKDAASSFVTVGGELWMETVPNSVVNEICAAFRKFGLNLCALSVMPPELLTKNTPLDKAKFICKIAAEKTSPNLLRTRSTSLDVKKISALVAAIFLIAALVQAAEIFSDWYKVSTELDAAQLSVNELRDDLKLKNFMDEDINELRRLNTLTTTLDPTKTFNLLVNLGKVFGGDVHLTNIAVDENSARLSGSGTSTDTVKSCLSRMKNFVAQTARAENSSATEDGEIDFAIRVDLNEN